MRGLLFFVLMSPQVSWSQSIDLIYKNNAAVRQFKAEKKMQAYEEFLSALLVSPDDPAVQFNVGSSLQALGENEKSEKLYKQLLATIDEKLKMQLTKEEQQQWLKVKFAALYNLGVHYQLQSATEQALEYYQKGLELLPDSKEIKTNIELMLNSSGGGKGKGDQKDNKDKQQGEGDPEGSDEDQQNDADKPRTNEPQDQGKDKKSGEDKQLSNEDLKRIMEELKQQEQSIRSKVQRKGDKSEPKGNPW